MTSSSDSNYSDLVQSIQSGPKLQQAVQHLTEYFSLDSIPKKDICSEVKCLRNVSGALEKFKEEFKQEYIAKKINDSVKTIVHRPGKVHYLSREILLAVIQSGWSELADIHCVQSKDNCCILMPAVVVGSGEAKVKERSTGRQTTAKFEIDSKLIISGRGSLWLPPQSLVVCAVLGVVKD